MSKQNTKSHISEDSSTEKQVFPSLPLPTGGGRGPTDKLNIHFGDNFKSMADKERIITLLHDIRKNGLPVIINALRNPGNSHQWLEDSYHIWFNKEEYKDKVAEMYEKIQAVLEDATQLVYFKASKRRKVYGYTVKRANKQTKIYLTKQYKNAPQKGMYAGDDSQYQILIHELSHYAGDTVDYEIDEKGNYSIVKSICQSSDIPNSNSPNCRTLSPGQCQDLAAKEPHNAIKNADNYGYFFDHFINMRAL